MLIRSTMERRLERNCWTWALNVDSECILRDWWTRPIGEWTKFVALQQQFSKIRVHFHPLPLFNDSRALGLKMTTIYWNFLKVYWKCYQLTTHCNQVHYIYLINLLVCYFYEFAWNRLLNLCGNYFSCTGWYSIARPACSPQVEAPCSTVFAPSDGTDTIIRKTVIRRTNARVEKSCLFICNPY
jgi:hypothetical protein